MDKGKRRTPGSRGAAGNTSARCDDVTPKAEKNLALDIWDACRQQRAAETARAMRVAEAVRKVALSLDAEPTGGDGEWQVNCPHCGAATVIWVEPPIGLRHVHGSSGCAATPQIQRLVCEALR